ncbi:hypothetical protein QBC44DRAFT_253576 [Cladorrhinum sp. PSN332]|nr:hypothetical protein QBC44DRAFT_253576 [Cladorrhinum sp. PSN332]
MSVFAPLREGPTHPSVSRATQACVACRKQKRKCDKTLPVCGLCARMNRPCDYTGDAQPPPTSEDLATLQARLNELENRLNNNPTEQQQHPFSQYDPSPSATLPPIPPKPQIAPPSSVSGPTPAPAGASSSSSPPLRLPSLSRFPTAIFLDIDCFNWASMPIPKPAVSVPPDVFDMLSRPNAVQEAATEFFAGPHVWFPFISKKRMKLGLALWDGGPELAFLFLAMKLVTSTPVEGVESAAASPMYEAAKRFLSQLEASGTVSLQLLQGMVLVTLYEIGHAVYPAAWMSVAACARYIEVLGVPSFRGSSRMLGSCTTWTESEERRRVWWAVYILDRFISLGNKKRFCMPEPFGDLILPVDDKAWASNIITSLSRALNSPLDAPGNQPQAPFSRLCQAAMQVSKVMTHVGEVIHGNTHHRPIPFDLSRVVGMSDTLAAFTVTVQQEISQAHLDLHASPSILTPASAMHTPASSMHTPGSSSTTSTASSNTMGLTDPNSPYPVFSLLPALTLSLSGLILLFDVYCTPENQHGGPSPDGPDAPPLQSAEHREMQLRAMNGLKEVAFKGRDVALEILDILVLPSEQRRLSPLCLDALYGALATLHWLWKESGDNDVRGALEDVRRCMSRVSMQWRLAKEYMDLLRHHDVNIAMEWRATQ